MRTVTHQRDSHLDLKADPAKPCPWCGNHAHTAFTACPVKSNPHAGGDEYALPTVESELGAEDLVEWRHGRRENALRAARVAAGGSTLSEAQVRTSLRPLIEKILRDKKPKGENQ